jgi:SAM-dependent methyltransferase
MAQPATPEDGDPADALFERLREQIAAQRRLAPPGSEVPQLDVRSFGHVTATIEQAAHFGRVGERLPSFGHLSMLRRWIASAVGRVLLYFFRLVTADQQRFNTLVLRALRTANANAQGLYAKLNEMPNNVLGILHERDERLAKLEEELAARDERLVKLEEELAARDRRMLRLENASGDRDQRLAALGAAMAECDERIRAARSVITERTQHDGEVRAAQQVALADLRASLTIFRAQLEALQRQQVAGAPAALAPQTPAPPRQTPPAPPLMSALVANDVLRGSEASIRERQAGYVRYFAGATEVLDVGCGRGEFLGLLGAAGIPARGVDGDVDMVLRCREQGLDVARDDALHYLAKLPEASLGGLVCIQVIEHWPTPALIEFIHSAARALRPGAPLLIETLNPESLLVLYRWYWLDVTHERLVHPQALQYLLRAAGFQDLECVFAPPPDGPVRIPPLTVAETEAATLQPFNAATQYLNDLLYASFDYAVVARR